MKSAHKLLIFMAAAALVALTVYSAHKNGLTHYVIGKSKSVFHDTAYRPGHCLIDETGNIVHIQDIKQKPEGLMYILNVVVANHPMLMMQAIMLDNKLPALVADVDGDNRIGMTTCP
jgi:hypothetical protein